jgi:hypothetical protein
MQNSSFIVKDANRKRERDLKESLKKDLVAFISEILTNADDSYRRLENSGKISKESIKEILIEIVEDRRSKGDFVVSITDNAEGMSEDDLRTKFERYGADKAEGDLLTRGLFGQGASDVLFNAAAENRTAMIESIKDGKFTRAKFNYDKSSSDLKEVKFVPDNKIGNQLTNIRKSIGIPENGTRVSFGIPKRVKYNPKTIIDEIQSYPYFKFLLNSKNRKITFVQETSLFPQSLSSSYFQLTDTTLFEKGFKFKYKTFELSCHLKLWALDKKKYKHDIMVIDQNQVVYDNHFFGFDTQPKAKNLGGFLIINDFYKVLRAELNSEDPIAIITDNRKGFDTTQEFYQILKENVVKIINAKLPDIGEDLEEIDLSSNKRVSEILKKLNSIFIQKMPEEIPYSGKEKGILPPEQGLAFVREEMSLTVTKKYMIELFIDSRKIDDQIPIFLSTDKEDVLSLSQKEIRFNKKDANAYGLVIKRFLVEALKYDQVPTKIFAKSDIYICEASIKTIEYDIHYPKNGMEFFPDRIRHKPNRNHMAYLFIDEKVFRPESIINISSNENFVQIEEKEIKVLKTDFDSNGIAIYKVSFTGGELGDKYTIRAEIESSFSLLKVEIVDRKNKENEGTLGLISSIKFHSDYDNKEEQAKFSKTDKVLMINRINPINKTMFSNINFLKDFNSISPKQLNYFLDICAYQAALQVLDYQMIHNEFVFQKEDFQLFQKRIYLLKTEIFEAIKEIKKIV